jgi:hypothetical protein
MSLATALLATLLAAPPNGAATQNAWFWNAPRQCPASDEVRTEVERHLESTMDALPLESWSVVGTVTHDPEAGFAAALVIETPDGRHDRLLTDPSDCAALSNSAALLIALALSPDGETSLEPEAPPPEPQRPSQPAPPPKPAPDPEPDPAPNPQPEPATPTDPIVDVDSEAPTPREALTFAIGLMPGFDWGTLRGLTPTSRLALAWQPRRLRISAAAQFGGTPPFALAPLAVRLRLWQWSLAAEAGPVPSLGRFEFPLMVGVEAGQLLLTPRALLPNASQVAWAALLLTPGVSWVPRSWFAVTARVGTTVAFVQQSFTIPGFEPILVTSRLGVRASLGIEFRIPLVMKTIAGGN